MVKPKKEEIKEFLFTFSQALDLVLQRQYRKLETPFIDARGNPLNVSIYRCSDSLVRVDFKTPKTTK